MKKFLSPTPNPLPQGRGLELVLGSLSVACGDSLAPFVFYNKAFFRLIVLIKD